MNVFINMITHPKPTIAFHGTAVLGQDPYNLFFLSDSKKPTAHSLKKIFNSFPFIPKLLNGYHRR